MRSDFGELWSWNSRVWSDFSGLWSGDYSVRSGNYVPEDPALAEPFLVELVLEEDGEDGEAVADAAAETDLGGFGEVAGLDGDLADPQAFPDALGDDLGVEDEVVRVLRQVHGFEVAPAVG